MQIRVSSIRVNRVQFSFYSTSNINDQTAACENALGMIMSSPREFFEEMLRTSPPNFTSAFLCPYHPLQLEDTIYIWYVTWECYIKRLVDTWIDSNYEWRVIVEVLCRSWDAVLEELEHEIKETFDACLRYANNEDILDLTGEFRTIANYIRLKNKPKYE